MIRVIVDRFEADFAVVELPDRNTVNMPLILLPPDTKEGDVIDIAINREATQQRKETVANLLDELWEE